MSAEWTVPDLVDLEYFLSQDAEADATVLARRDREIYQTRTPETAGTSRRDLLHHWLDRRRAALRPETAPLPGEVVAPLLKITPVLLFLLGSLAGGLLAWGVLSYAGDQPINLFAALGLLVAVPFFLSLLSAVLPVWRRALGGTPAGLLGGWLTALLLTRLSRRAYALLAHRNEEDLARHWGTLRGRGSLYAGLTGWLAFGWLQLTALGFSLAVLLMVLLRGWIADLAFSWQTTTRLSAEQVHGFIAALAKPWSPLADPPLAHPTLEQVAGSRVFLKEGLQHLASADLQSWWYFLLWAILVYTVLPRLLLLGVALAGGRYARRRLSFADARCEALLRRMRQPHLETGKDAQAAAERSPELILPDEFGPGMERLHVLIPVELLTGAAAERWRSELQREFSASVEALEGVSLDETEDADQLRNLAGESGQTPVLLVLEGWQPCITATLEYLKALRRRLGQERLLVVALVGRESGEYWRAPTPEHEFGIWRQRLAALGDPWLLVHNWGRSADA